MSSSAVKGFICGDLAQADLRMLLPECFCFCQVSLVMLPTRASFYINSQLRKAVIWTPNLRVNRLMVTNTNINREKSLSSTEYQGRDRKTPYLFAPRQTPPPPPNPSLQNWDLQGPGCMCSSQYQCPVQVAWLSLKASFSVPMWWLKFKPTG